MAAEVFDFDCPSKYFDLAGAGSDSSRPQAGAAAAVVGGEDEETDAWFHMTHPSHDAVEIAPISSSINTSDDMAQPTLKSRPGGIRSGAVMRVNMKGKSEGSSHDHSEPSTRKVPTKTAVALVSFENAQPGNRKATDSAPLNLKLLRKDEPTTASAPKAPSRTVSSAPLSSGSTQSANMKSKLEEYKTKKAAQPTTTSAPATKTAVVPTKPVGGAAARKPAAKPGSAGASGKNAADSDDMDMLALLKKHNEKFAAVPLYEPPMHSVRDVRNWERSTGKAWATLTAEERTHANREITEMKRAAGGSA